MSDAELTLCWQRGDEAAFEILYKRYVSRLLATAMRKTGDRVISEEFVNDAFLKLYQNKSGASEILSIEAYLSAIIRNRTLDHYRRASVHQKYKDFCARYYSELDFSTVNELELKALKDHIDLDVAKLPPKCRTVFKMSKFGSLSNREIAQTLGISENTVEQHMRKALRLLKSSVVFYGRYSSVLVIFMAEILK